MADRRRTKKRRKKALFAVEIVILAVLCVALFGAVWFTQKMSLINYKELDRTKLVTSEQANATAQGEVAPEDEPEVTAEPVVVTQQPEQTESDDGLSGIETIALIGLDTRPQDEETGDNSDTMIICVINHNDKTIKLASLYRDTYLNIGFGYDMTVGDFVDEDCYTKANAAYNFGGAEQCLTMLNMNLDLNITEYITVDFVALAKCIDVLGGLDIEMTREEVIHMNNYNVETSEACGVEYEYIDIDAIPTTELDGNLTMSFHLNGTQAVSYARIRFTEGNDFRRASRQRLVLSLIKEKAMNTDPFTINTLLDTVLPYVTTNLDAGRLISVAWPILSYDMGEDAQTGFPFIHLEEEEAAEKTGEDAVFPVTLEHNVKLLHEFLYGETLYSPPYIVQDYSYEISKRTGYTAADIEYASTNETNEDIVILSEEEKEEWRELMREAEEEDNY